MDEIRQQLKPGAKVKITQQIVARDHTWLSEVVGTILAFEQAKTGSWYAHARDDRLWLDRLKLKKENGETSILNLDQYSLVEFISIQPNRPPAASSLPPNLSSMGIAHKTI
jgi:hypothetical protein